MSLLCLCMRIKSLVTFRSKCISYEEAKCHTQPNLDGP
jgi:hypothetical protein